MHNDGKDQWEDAEKKYCKQFNITPLEFHKILGFAFGEAVRDWCNSKWYEMLLDLSHREILKAIKRLKPKLDELDHLLYLRKQNPEGEAQSPSMSAYEEELYDKSIKQNVIKTKSGIWRQG